MVELMYKILASHKKDTYKSSFLFLIVQYSDTSIKSEFYVYKNKIDRSVKGYVTIFWKITSLPKYSSVKKNQSIEKFSHGKVGWKKGLQKKLRLTAPSLTLPPSADIWSNFMTAVK